MSCPQLEPNPSSTVDMVTPRCVPVEGAVFAGGVIVIL